MNQRWPHRRTIACVALVLGLCGCSAEVMSIALDASETASTVFKEAKDEARIKRDSAASERLGELLVGPKGLTVEELQPLKRMVAEAKADGKVTLDEADRILVEMERVITLRPPKRPR